MNSIPKPFTQFYEYMVFNHDFIVYIAFTRIASSNTTTVDVTN